MTTSSMYSSPFCRLCSAELNFAQAAPSIWSRAAVALHAVEPNLDCDELPLAVTRMDTWCQALREMLLEISFV